MLAIPVLVSTLRNMASRGLSHSLARSNMPRVTAMVRPLQVPQQDMTTNAKISAPPTCPNTFWKASFAPASPPAIMTSDSTAPARPM